MPFIDSVIEGEFSYKDLIISQPPSLLTQANRSFLQRKRPSRRNKRQAFTFKNQKRVAFTALYKLPVYRERWRSGAKPSLHNTHGIRRHYKFYIFLTLYMCFIGRIILPVMYFRCASTNGLWQYSLKVETGHKKIKKVGNLCSVIQVQSLELDQQRGTLESTAVPTNPQLSLGCN